jgi:hypothetical protein
MTRESRLLRRSLRSFTIAAVAIACGAFTSVVSAQTATKAPPPNAQPPVPPSTRPAAPPAPVVAAPAPVPPAGAVALCVDNTFVKDPGTVADCAKHGGLKVAMPPHQKTVVRKASPALAVSAAAAIQAPPAGATMHCKDGTYLTGAPSKDRCANNGGVAAILPSTPPAPAAPARRP